MTNTVGPLRERGALVCTVRAQLPIPTQLDVLGGAAVSSSGQVTGCACELVGRPRCSGPCAPELSRAEHVLVCCVVSRRALFCVCAALSLTLTVTVTVTGDGDEDEGD